MMISNQTLRGYAVSQDGEQEEGEEEGEQEEEGGHGEASTSTPSPGGAECPCRVLVVVVVGQIARGGRKLETMVWSGAQDPSMRRCTGNVLLRPSMPDRDVQALRTGIARLDPIVRACFHRAWLAPRRTLRSTGTRTSWDLARPRDPQG